MLLNIVAPPPKPPSEPAPKRIKLQDDHWAGVKKPKAIDSRSSNTPQLPSSKFSQHEEKVSGYTSNPKSSSGSNTGKSSNQPAASQPSSSPSTSSSFASSNPSSGKPPSKENDVMRRIAEEVVEKAAAPIDNTSVDSMQSSASSTSAAPTRIVFKGGRAVTVPVGKGKERGGGGGGEGRGGGRGRGGNDETIGKDKNQGNSNAAGTGEKKTGGDGSSEGDKKGASSGSKPLPLSQVRTDLAPVVTKQAPKLANEEKKSVGANADGVLVKEGSFISLGLSEKLATHLEKSGYERPSNIQKLAVPRILTTGGDALVKSETGSGKTLAYALPIINSLTLTRISREDGTQALVLAPTRELVLQIDSVIRLVCKPFPWVIVSTLMGGENKKAEKARLRKGVTIVVGSPGRVKDHIDTTSAWMLNEIRWLVLDEADRLLDMGFDQTVRAIYTCVEAVQAKDKWQVKRRNVLVSATLDKGSGVDELAAVVLKEPVLIGFENEEDETDEKGGNKGKEKSKGKGGDEEGEESSIGKKRKRPDDDNRDDDDSDSSSSSSSDDDSDDSNDDDDKKKKKLKDVIKKTNEQGKAMNDKDENGEDGEREGEGEEEDEAQGDEATGEDEEKQGEKFTVPTTLDHEYIAMHSRHRLVALAAFLRLRVVSARRAKKRCKMIVFVSTCPAVEFLHKLFTHTFWPDTVSTQAETAVDAAMAIIKKSKAVQDGTAKDERLPLLDTQIWKLHGNMQQKMRTSTFFEFSSAAEGILLCTDVAARGLDMPAVDWIIQYDAPEDVASYVHRSGRTARIGHEGHAVLFLVQTELPFLTVLRRSTGINFKEIVLAQVLSGLHIGLPKSVAELTGRENKSERLPAGAILQKQLEAMVIANAHLAALARDAYISFLRAYATYPKDLKHIFHPKLLHFGEVAHSFALKEKPTDLGSSAAATHKEVEATVNPVAVERRLKAAGVTDPKSDATKSNKLARREKFTAGKPKPQSVHLGGLSKQRDKKENISEFQ